MDESDPVAGSGERDDPGDRAVTVEDDHLAALLDRPQMLGQTVLELRDANASHGQI